MRHLLFTLLILCFTGILNPVIATHLIGGEISWECHPTTGQYRFTVRLYRECGIPNTAGMPALVPLTGGPVTIACSQIQLVDVSPQCYDSNLGISCGVTPVGQGAIQMGVFRSAWTTLNGIPPASGWQLQWGSCCRPSSIAPGGNLISTSFQLRSTMYPYNNLNVSTCFNSSPNFKENPRLIACSGKEYNYNSIAIDNEMDSLYYSWGHAKESNGMISTYASGFSYDNPIPDAAFNTLNTGAFVDPNSGQLSFTCFTQGAYAVVLKIEEWRYGQRISETFRDFPIFIRPCNSSSGPCSPVVNSAPSIALTADSMRFPSAPKVKEVFDANGKVTSYKSVVEIGDTIRTLVFSADSDLKANCQPDLITLSGRGLNFTADSTYNNPQQCSFLSPCATLISQNQGGGFQSTDTNLALFEWSIDLNHISLLNLDLRNYVNYQFYFDVSDDQCPMPAADFIMYEVQINLDIPNPPSVDNECLDIDGSSGDVSFNLGPSTDTSDFFGGYVVYFSLSELGPFMPIDTIANYGATSFTDYGRGAGRSFYFLRTISNFLSRPSDTLTTINLEVNPSIRNNPTYAFLSWNPLYNYSGPMLYYQIWKKELPTSNWSLIDSTQATKYLDTLIGDFTDVDYRIGINGKCFSIEAPFIGLEEDEVMQNIRVYPNPFLDQLIIQLPNELKASEVKLVLFDVSGKKLKTTTQRISLKEIKLEGLNNLPKGVYVLHLSANNKTKSFKLIH